ncbi:MAG: GntR family transcriptional regulator [Ilumatobacter fluminis]|uniref:GntR family transcriptional regulator n=1 Tax=Ilumatobacter fluminis TaxID=467091 RepID=UPI0032EFAB79
MTDSAADDFFAGFVLDRASGEPAYHQLEDWLTGRIRSGDLEFGSSLPPERDIARVLGISRMTVRQALDRPVRDGLLVRNRGAGTTVGRPRLVGERGRLGGISDVVARQGHDSTTRVLSFDDLEPPRDIARALALPPSARAMRLRRLRRVDDEPFSLETSWLHPEACAALAGTDLNGRSLFEALTNDCGIDLAEARESVTATTLDAFEADQLTLDPGAAAFRVRRTTLDADGAVVEVVSSVIRADRFSFEASIQRTDADPYRPTPQLSQENS